VLGVHRSYRADDRAVLIGHDWGAQAGYGVVATEPGAFGRFVALAVPPIGALAAGMFSYAQLQRSF
jgi:pimeloyl-ACP methyl ester carboxylesterase